MSRAAYEITVLGRVPASLLDDFAGVTATLVEVGTVMHADSIDPAQLQGLLNALHRNGLVLAEVRRAHPAESWADQAGAPALDNPGGQAE